MTSVNSPPFNQENVNKLKRIDQLHSEQEQAYRAAVTAAMVSIEQNGLIKLSIQKAALALEEIYQLHGQEWMTQEIGSIIVKDLKVRGFPDAKYRYVYEALQVYGNRFYKSIEHCSTQTVSPLTKPQELFYRTNAQRYYDCINIIKELRHDYENLTRKDIQTIVPSLLDLYDENEKECKSNLIILEKNRQDGFDGGPEQYEDRISIHKPIPKVPEIMKEELDIWMFTFLPALLQKFTEYPVDSETEKRMSAGWAALRHLHDPSCDDKYRETFPDWVNIVQFADSSFKHHAASHFKTIDWRGLPRKLTREQIGARQKSIPAWCKWFFDTIPGFMEEVAWFRESKKQYLSGFSIDLSPKLSDRSIR